MAIESNCTGCGNRLSVAEEHAGKKARCPACGMIYVVGGQAGPDAAGSGNDFGLAPTSYGSENQDAVSDSAGSDNSGAGSSQSQFWMKATDGAEYGPVDRETLGRWFQEGRIASEYQIREGETGQWQQAAVFQSAASANPYASSTNPYASSTNPYAGGTTAAAATKQYVKADQSGLVLAMGILGLFFCGIFAIVAWVMGHSALKDMQVGAMDPTNKGITQVGYYMGIVSVCLHVFGCAAYIIVVALVVAAG